MTTSDWFPVPVRLAVKSDLTNWCCQNLSKHVSDEDTGKTWKMESDQMEQHTHTRLMAIFPGLPGWAGTRKVKPIWILLKQETMSGSGISWLYASLHLAPDR